MTEQPPPVKVEGKLWRLDADPFRVRSSADAWRKAGKAAAAAGHEIVQSSRHVLSDGWAGPVRDSFARHRSRLAKSLDGVRIRAEEVARELEAIAGRLRQCQHELDDALDRLCQNVLCLNDPRLMLGSAALAGNGLVFLPRTPEEVVAINGAVRQARALRRDLKAALGIHAGKLERAQQSWRVLAATWKPMAEGLEARTFRLPDEIAGTMVLVAHGRAVVNTGPREDNVEVSKDPATGQLVIDVNGVKHYQPRGTEVTIRGGEGHDTVKVAEGTVVRVTLLGAAGEDRPHDEGDDVVHVEVVDVVGVIRLDGSKELQERILDDLHPLETSRLGHTFMNQLTISDSQPGRPVILLYHEFGNVHR